jgi:hypothetical protein
VARLTTKTRSAIPTKDFAGPGRSFPIEDIEHGRKALQLDTHKPAAERARIAAKVHRKFPSIGKMKPLGEEF